jgi:hypothetical protein
MSQCSMKPMRRLQESVIVTGNLQIPRRDDVTRNVIQGRDLDVTTHLRKFTAPTLRPVIGSMVRISHALRMYETSTSKKHLQ